MTDFDRLGASTPANATAARVTSRGTHWEPSVPLPTGLQHWKSPPPMRPFASASPDIVDMTGKKFGRFTVIGFLDDEAGGRNHGGRWVVRCACGGDFEAKSARAIKQMMSMTDQTTSGFHCWYCSQWLKAKHRYEKHGSRPVSYFTRPQEKVVAKRPIEDIVADRLAASGTLPHARLALMIIADLQKQGFRIVRHQRSTQRAA
jgi:hypothetical protein